AIGQFHRTWHVGGVRARAVDHPCATGPCAVRSVRYHSREHHRERSLANHQVRAGIGRRGLVGYTDSGCEGSAHAAVAIGDGDVIVTRACNDARGGFAGAPDVLVGWGAHVHGHPGTTVLVSGAGFIDDVGSD